MLTAKFQFHNSDLAITSGYSDSMMKYGIGSVFMLRVLSVSRKFSTTTSQLIKFDLLRSHFKVYGPIDVSHSYVLEQKDVTILGCSPNYIGFKFGYHVLRIKTALNEGKYESSVVEELHSLGLVSNENIALAAKIFVEKNGKGAVPLNFVVPSGSESGWPSSLSGTPLGLILARISPRNPFRRQLEAIGLIIHSGYINMLVYDTLKAYKQIHGHLNIPKLFEVPTDDSRYPAGAVSMKLGVRLRLLQTYSDINPDFRAMCEELGAFGHILPRAESFSDVYASLVAFKQIHGHLRIPLTFVVPTGDTRYPAGMWGRRLGVTLFRIRRNAAYREFREQLTQLGVEWAAYRRFYGAARVIGALRTFQRLHGHLEVDRGYVIPQGAAEYPEGTQGMKLGRLLQLIRRRKVYSRLEQQIKQQEEQQQQQQQESKNESGSKGTVVPSLASEVFKTNTSTSGSSSTDSSSGSSTGTSRAERFELIFSALQVFKTLNGHLRVPYEYRIAQNDRAYPEKARGLSLGQTVMGIRRNGSFSEYRERLEALGVDFTVHRSDRYSFETIYRALLAFKKYYGHIQVPSKFVVPVVGKASEHFPLETLGMKLGDMVVSMRLKGYYKEHSQRLEELGIERETERRTSFEVIYEALLAFKLVYGHVRVPPKYEVEIGDLDYSASAWGLKLGSKMHDIRHNRTYRQHRKRLEAIGFEYHKPTV